MMKSAIVLIAFAIASAACGPVTERNAEIELELSKNECQRSRSRAHNEIGPLFDQVFEREISEDLKNYLLKSYREAESAYNALSDDIERAESMNITNEIYTAFGTEIHCNEEFAQYIAKISNTVRNIFKENGILVNSYNAEFAAKKLELVKKECKASIYRAGNEIYQMYHRINPLNMTQEQNDIMFEAIQERSRKNVALNKEVMEAKSLEAVEGFFTPLSGVPIHCNEEFAGRVLQDSSDELDVFKKQGFF